MTLQAVEVDHDFETNMVDVEFEDGSCKSFLAKPLSRKQAIKIIIEYVKQQLKKDDAFERLDYLHGLSRYQDAHDYELTEDINMITGDYGYFVAWPDGSLSISRQPTTGVSE